MGNLPSSRRNSRISQNPGVHPPSRMIPAPPGYPGAHAPPPPGPSSYPPHLPYYPYPPYNNSAIPAPQYFHSIQSNGQYMMNLPPPQMFRNEMQGVISTHPVPPPQRTLEVAEHQKANTIQNDVNLKKATLRLEKDEENPGYHLVAFSFDATVAGRSVFPSILAVFGSPRESRFCAFWEFVYRF